MSGGFRWFYVPLIFLLPLLAIPGAVWYWMIQPVQKEWKTQLDTRNTARGAYGGDTTFTGLWPPEGAGPEVDERFQPGLEDQQAQEQAFEQTMVDRQEELELQQNELAAHEAMLAATLNRYMVGIRRDRLDYEKPDELVLELLRLQRDIEGPHLIEFLDRTYPRLFFEFDHALPAPPINLQAGSLPPTGPFGRLEWPVGAGAYEFTVYGPYEALLDFVETFPERYDRIAQISDFSMQRIGFDHRGNVLMQMNVTIQLYVWPENAATAAAPAPGMEGMMMEPGMEGMPQGDPGMAPPGDVPPGDTPPGDAGMEP